MNQRRRLRIQGVVQGVGFRPFVFGLAHRLQLGGLVGNDAEGVFLEIEGPDPSLQEFERLLRLQSPPVARIDAVESQPMEALGESDFVIVASSPARVGSMALVSPDQCLCPECRSELLDPGDRRYFYPFLNCTQCGPRFTIILATPYDRPMTTMASFVMCPLCQAEYRDSGNRRFHAQPNACAQCGPALQWWQDGIPQDSQPPWEQAWRHLGQGGVLAVKGIGGFHLACDARNPQAVARLRQLKQRPHKPLAIMARDLQALRTVASPSPVEEGLLLDRSRPIVLVQGKGILDLGTSQIGAMLPYTGLHELLLSQGPDLLVMTSANPPGAPIEYGHPGAVRAPAVLNHNRPIHVPCDDSVAMVFRDSPVLLRRSRGFAPLPLALPYSVPPLLAVGGELKNTFCLAQGKQAYLSQHLGDLQNLETLIVFEHSLAHFRTLFGIDPRAIAIDLHPGYLGRGWAQSQSLPLIEVQHHHAHLAALMAEHGLDTHQRLLGFCFDGTGYGPDATIWGGEVLWADYSSYQRLGHLSPMPIVGGDQAVRSPYRLALAYLWACQLDPCGLACERACPTPEARVLYRQWQLGRFVTTSSVGRLFDVVASLCGICQQVTFEGQAAMLLEACADSQERTAYEWDQRWQVSELLSQVVADVRNGVAAGRISARFHRALARAVARQASALGADRVGLSGGVFQNRVLLEACLQELERAGVQVLWHTQLPSNDGGLALGQIAVAGLGRE